MRHLLLWFVVLMVINGCDGGAPPVRTDGGTDGGQAAQVLDPARSTLVVDPPRVTADGVATALVAVVLLDERGNPIGGRRVGLEVSGSGNTVSATVTSSDQGQASFSIASTVAEPKTVRALVAPGTADAVALSTQAAVTFVAGPPSATTSTFEWLDDTAAADGVSTMSARVTARDVRGNLITAGTPVSFEPSLVGAVVQPATGTTDAQGQLEVTMTSSRSGMVRLTAALSSVSLPLDATFSAGPPDYTQSVLTLSPSTGVADGVSPLAVEVLVKDVAGTPVPGASVALSVSGTDATLGMSSATSGVDGRVTTTLVSTAVGSRTVTALIGPFALQQQATFVAGAATVAQSSLSANPTTLANLGTTTVTLQARDALGHPVSGVGVQFGASLAGAFVPATGATDATGRLTAVFTAAAAGTVRLTADGGTSFTLTTDVTVTPTCVDQQRNGVETDVDCGGGTCGPCAVNRACGVHADCASATCLGDVCRTPTCSDTVRNGTETDDDCGGTCPKCADTKSCNAPADCLSGVCTGGRCAVPACTDTVKNGSETDIDCGSTCSKCDDTKNCNAPADCLSGVCTSGRCAVPACTDTVKNGSETDQDCGGSCPKCDDTKSCAVPADCLSGVCTNNRCAAPACTDTVKNGSETDIDCGSTCPKCDDTKSCNGPADCLSGVCTSGRCAVPACTDTVRNGAESDVDCGGSCAKCADTLRCNGASDCVSGVCSAGRCAVPTCSDGVKNGSETDLDCGGPCPKCADTKSCNVHADCLSNACFTGTCRAPTCVDGRLNGAETDLDCGGGTCPRCADTLTCALPRDCQSSVCTSQRCAAPTCNDTVVNGVETDVDCGGGTCATCGVLKTCARDVDCTSAMCLVGRCRQYGFDVRSYGPIATQALSITAGDVTNDGRPEVLTIAYSGAVFSSFQNLGDGGFLTPPLDVPSLSGGSALVTGRFNADPYVDVVTSSDFWQLVSVHLGQADGGFSAGVTFNGGGRDLAAVDFNRDDQLDLVAIQSAGGSRNAVVLMGNGDGTFAAANFIAPCIGGPTRVATADVNQDGNPDFAVLCDNLGVGTTGSVLISRWTGTGSNFASYATLTTGNAPHGLALGRLDGDAYPDVVVANDVSLSLFLGSSTGFAPPTTVPLTLSRPEAVALTDLNADGANDVVVSDNFGNVATVFLGRGDGTLAPPVSFATGTGPSDVVAADFDGDGRMDVAFSNQWSNDVTVVLSQCR